jgi:hypothetical protein
MLLNVFIYNILYTGPLSIEAQYSRSCPIISSSCYNSSLVIWTVVCLTAAKFKPLIFPLSGFALSNIANICIFMILYDFCLFPALFCYIIVYIWKFESHVQIANRCAPWKISNGAENFVLQALQFQQMACFNCPPYNSFSRTKQKTRFPTVPLLFHASPLRGNVFNELLLRKGCTRYNINNLNWVHIIYMKFSTLQKLSIMPWRHMGEWRYSSIILSLGTRWSWVVTFTPWSLYPPRKEPTVHIG